MPYPVLPPEPLPIVQHLLPEHIVHQDNSSVSLSLVRNDLGASSSNVSVKSPILNPKENTDAAPSPTSTAKSAALLGEAQSLELPVEQEAVTSDWQTETAFPPSPTLSFQSQQAEEILEFSLKGHIAPTKGPIQIQSENPLQPNNPALVGIVEVFADQQEFDLLRQIFSAEGNVVVRYQGGVLDADRVQGSLLNRITVAEGNVSFRRGTQLLRGERLVYNFLQDTGTMERSRGEIFLPTSGAELTFGLPSLWENPTLTVQQPLSTRLLDEQPLQRVVGAGGYTYAVGGGRANVNLPAVRAGAKGTINRVRFEAENLDFYPRGWTATNIRLTNDPFSPPELEIRADRGVFTRVSPLRDILDTKHPRLVFDQGFSLPLLQSRFVFDRTEREPPIYRFGYDDGERGGLFVEAPLSVINNGTVKLKLTPQFFLQRAVTQGFGNLGELFGLRTQLSFNPTPRTFVSARTVIQNFDLWNDGPDKIRADFLAQQIIGTTYPHKLVLGYYFRDRLFNGSLGFQDVYQSIGGVLLSPIFNLGKTGITLTYQVGAQYISANTDFLNLLKEPTKDTQASLGRFQASATVSRGIYLWRGKPLPATPTEGLRYTPVPVIPFVQLLPVATGTTSIYSSGDTQSTLSTSIGIQGQFGHFSRPFFDYTAFNLRYTKVIQNGISPFFFDRSVDNQVLAFGLTQQIYGPFRVGFQSSFNLDTRQSISTDVFLEYSRRTYGVIIRYNVDLQLGAIVLRISDFNWNNNTQPFQGSGVRFIDTGVIQQGYD